MKIEWTMVADKSVFSNQWTLAEFISKMDKNDPHYGLKLANLIKGYTHGVIADEQSAAQWRTQDICLTPEEFMEFFKARVVKHQGARDAWFEPAGDNWKLKHFYSKNDPNRPKSCTSTGDECRCWEIKEEDLK